MIPFENENRTDRGRDGKINVAAVARLAKLDFSDEEMASLEKDMNAIINFADKLGEADTANEDISLQINPLQNVFRDDEPVSGIPTEKLIAAAKTQENGYITVPRVIGEQEGANP